MNKQDETFKVYPQFLLLTMRSVLHDQPHLREYACKSAFPERLLILHNHLFPSWLLALVSDRPTNHQNGRCQGYDNVRCAVNVKCFYSHIRERMHTAKTPEGAYARDSPIGQEVISFVFS